MKGKKTGGRTKGTPNKATREVKTFCASLLESARYQRQLRERVHKGTLPPALEAMLWHYAYGVPRQTVAEPKSTTSDLVRALEQTVEQARRAIACLRKTTIAARTDVRDNVL